MLQRFLIVICLALLPIYKANAMEQNMSTKQVMQVTINNLQIDYIGDIVYSQIISTRANRQLKMSILVPRSNKPMPAIVYYPGGGFTSAVHDKYIQMRLALAQEGFVVAAVEYRTVPDKYPALVNDAKAAVRFLRAHAKQFNIDTKRIGVLGDSAGGYLSAMMGVTNGEQEFDVGEYLDQSSDVQAAVSIYGISNLLNIGEGFSEAVQKVHQSPAVTEALLVHGVAFADFVGASIFSDKQKALAASPINHVKTNMPAFLLMHGTNDKLVSIVQSEQLYKALLDKKNEVEFVVVEGAGHGDISWYQDEVINKVVSWFKQNLMTKEDDKSKIKIKNNALDNL